MAKFNNVKNSIELPNYWMSAYERQNFMDSVKLVANRPFFNNLKSILNSQYKDFLFDLASNISAADGYTEQWGGHDSEYENAFKDIASGQFDLKKHDFVINYIYPALETLREHKIFVFEPWEELRFTGDDITKNKLEPNQILVFPSNRGGRHGKGLAKEALKFGAVLGIGEGLQGQTYALPTKDEKVQTLSLNEIKKHIETFKIVAEENPHLEFLVSKIGCGLAGYHPIQIRPLFGWYNPLIHKNIILPLEFIT